MESTTLPLANSTEGPDRDRLVLRAKYLARLGLAWHGIEAAVAIGAGVVAGSIALIGFGADSLVEAVAGIIVLWRFAGSRAGSETAELRAQKLIGISFFVIAAYVGFEAIRTLIAGDHPEVATSESSSRLPPSRRCRPWQSRRPGSGSPSVRRPRSRRVARTCFAPISPGLLLIGLSANAAFGWWWADPVTALVIAAVAVNEGREAWRGESCCVDSGKPGECADDCC